jgi:hypothetical protein
MPPEETKLPVKKEPLPLILSGADHLVGPNPHTGIVIKLSTDSVPSKLMIPDVTGLTEGKTPIYITKALKLKGTNLKKYLVKKGVITSHLDANNQETETIARLLDDSSVSCDAFYYKKDGPMLMAFDLNFDEGLIKDLVGDADLSALFEIHGASVRILRCTNEEELEELKKYVAELQG